MNRTLNGSLNGAKNGRINHPRQAPFFPPPPPPVSSPPVNRDKRVPPQFPPVGWIILLCLAYFFGHSWQKEMPPSKPVPNSVVPSPAPEAVRSPPPGHFDYAPRASLVKLPPPTPRAVLMKLPPLRFTDGSSMNLTYRGSLGSEGALPLSGNTIGDTYFVKPNWWIWLGSGHGENGWVDP
jgi:hypothetical protein